MDCFISEHMEGSGKALATNTESHGKESTGMTDGASDRSQTRRTEAASSQTGVRAQDQFDHECSLTAWANKRRCLQEEDGEGYLPKISLAVKEVLPDLM